MKDGPTALDLQTPRDLLPLFYKQYGLEPDGGQLISHVRIEIAKHFVVYFPNFNARRKVVLKHDIHHLVTLYPSTFKGETEIGGWELASGCWRYWVAFTLNIQAMMVGLFYNLPGVFRAYVRGRRTRNLYYSNWNDEKILDSNLQQIRQHLLLDKHTGFDRYNIIDILSFIGMILVGILYGIAGLLIFPFILIYTLYVTLTLKIKKSRQ